LISLNNLLYVASMSRRYYMPCCNMFESKAVMSVRRRTWKTPKGETKEAWIVDYVDQHGDRHIKTFARKKDADAYHARVAVDVGAGTHTADSRSITVAEAGKLWIQSAEAAKLERSTLESYRRHLNLHIVPFIGDVKLALLTMPTLRAYEDRLRAERSAVMVRKVFTSLSSMLADAQERGLVAQNVARNMRTKRARGKERHAERRQRGKLKVGVDIPTPDEVRAIIAHLNGRWRPMFLTMIFTGLRASELRGLRWADVDLKRGEIHVRQRADRWRAIGRPKSETSERTIPLLPMVANALREWKLACPKGELDLAFPNGAGRIEDHGNIAERGWIPTQIAAGITDKRGRAKYPGLHALRHFYASWCINRRQDGGLELPLKLVQARLGHASIQMTADRYGHLFPRVDDDAEMAAAEKAFLG
jgi:integrase